jgi:hypothetical protein
MLLYACTCIHRRTHSHTKYSHTHTQYSLSHTHTQYICTYDLKEKVVYPCTNTRQHTHTHTHKTSLEVLLHSVLRWTCCSCVCASASACACLRVCLRVCVNTQTNTDHRGRRARRGSRDRNRQRRWSLLGHIYCPHGCSTPCGNKAGSCDAFITGEHYLEISRRRRVGSVRTYRAAIQLGEHHRCSTRGC